jgi:hypothetical protein
VVRLAPILAKRRLTITFENPSHTRPVVNAIGHNNMNMIYHESPAKNSPRAQSRSGHKRIRRHFGEVHV